MYGPASDVFVLARLRRADCETARDFALRCAKAVEIIRRESDYGSRRGFQIEYFPRWTSGSALVNFERSTEILASNECLVAKVADREMRKHFIFFDDTSVSEMPLFESFALWATDHGNGKDYFICEGSYAFLKQKAAKNNERGRDYWIKDDPNLEASQEQSPAESMRG